MRGELERGDQRDQQHHSDGRHHRAAAEPQRLEEAEQRTREQDSDEVHRLREAKHGPPALVFRQDLHERANRQRARAGRDPEQEEHALRQAL